MLNESFPYFDDFALIVGKDRATGSDCRTPGEMIEELDREVENGEANLFGNNNEDTEAMEINDDSTRSSAPTSSTQSTRRKRKTSRHEDSLMESLSDNIGKFTEVCAASAENIGQIAKCFQFETAMQNEASQRRMNIYAEVRKIDGLRRDEILRAAHLLIQNQLNTDFFFSLTDEESKFEFIQMILGSG